MAWPDNWSLKESYAVSLNEVVHYRIGSGPPLVLVHGTPSWSYLWRKVARRLATKFTVHLYDLPGYGWSAKFEGQDVSIATQARVLCKLLSLWRLSGVPVVGHDIGGAIVLGAHILHGAPFSSILLLDAVVTAPWITPNTRHQKKWIEAFQTMPVHIYERVAKAHLATAFERQPSDQVLEAYFEPWQGAEGQAAWYRKIIQFDEGYSDLIVPGFKDVSVPVRLVWGEHDAWLSRDVAQAVQRAAPAGTELRFVPGGHFTPEDNPEGVAAEIASFAR